MLTPTKTSLIVTHDESEPLIMPKSNNGKQTSKTKWDRLKHTIYTVDHPELERMIARGRRDGDIVFTRFAVKALESAYREAGFGDDHYPANK